MCIVCRICTDADALNYTFKFFFLHMVFPSVSLIARTAQDLELRMHRKSIGVIVIVIRSFVLNRATMVHGKLDDIAERLCMCVRVRINLNKSHMSFPRARVTQPVMCVLASGPI